MHITKCKLLRTRLMKWSYIPSLLVGSIPTALAGSLTAIITFSYSSASNRFGTSPKMLYSVSFPHAKIRTRIQYVVNVLQKVFLHYLCVGEQEHRVCVVGTSVEIHFSQVFEKVASIVVPC
jgi:hypothetical protein